MQFVKQVLRRLWGRSYHSISVDAADEAKPIRGAKVLIVGANTGEDCKLFIARGAKEVHGLDVLETVGQNFRHPKVTYHRQSIEKTTLPADHFDLVFAVATMEHVPDVAAGFSEMGRLVRPGGAIYSSAAPLWQSAYGHHMGCFQDHPWVHLLFDQPGLVRYARARGIEGERGHDIEGISRYMLDRANFNMRPAEDYIAACQNLSGVIIIENKLYQDETVSLDHPLGKRALEAGYSPESLLASRHVLIAIKPQ